MCIEYIKSKYLYKEVFELQKLPLKEKEKIAVEILRQAFEKSTHHVALAFSGGKDSEVVADLVERFLPEQFQKMYCIFGNTGIEFPESLKFARKYGKNHFGERFHETELGKLAEDELKYSFAKQVVQDLEEENALDEILKADGKMKGQKALLKAAEKRGYPLNRHTVYKKGSTKNFTYCIEQYGLPLLGKSASKLDAHRINIECFLKHSQSASEKPELHEYYNVLRECKFSQHCCKLLKKEPSERKQAELDVDVIIKGLMANESKARLQNFASRGHIFESHRPHINNDQGGFFHVSPISLWTDQDVWDYIHKYDLEYSPLYDITYTAQDGTTKRIKRNGCIMCGTDLQFKDNHLAVLRQTHPKAWKTCMEHFGYREELSKLFRIKKNKNILDVYTEDGTSARMINRLGDQPTLFDYKPCAFDDFGELVDLNGTGIDGEYDSENAV